MRCRCGFFRGNSSFMCGRCAIFLRELLLFAFSYLCAYHGFLSKQHIKCNSKVCYWFAWWNARWLCTYGPRDQLVAPPREGCNLPAISSDNGHVTYASPEWPDCTATVQQQRQHSAESKSGIRATTALLDAAIGHFSLGWAIWLTPLVWHDDRSPRQYLSRGCFGWATPHRCRWNYHS